MLRKGRVFSNGACRHREEWGLPSCVFCPCDTQLTRCSLLTFVKIPVNNSMTPSAMSTEAGVCLDFSCKRALQAKAAALPNNTFHLPGAKQ